MSTEVTPESLRGLDQDLRTVLDDEYGLTPFALNADAARDRVRAAVDTGAHLVHELTREKLAQSECVITDFDSAHQQVKAERDAAASDVAYWREQFRLACDESEDRKRQVAAVTAERDTARFFISEYQQMCREARAERDRANAAVANLIKERNDEEARADAANAEAARGRCQRED